MTVQGVPPVSLAFFATVHLSKQSWTHPQVYLHGLIVHMSTEPRLPDLVLAGSGKLLVWLGAVVCTTICRERHGENGLIERSESAGQNSL
jgi:hypothetical protein